MILNEFSYLQHYCSELRCVAESLQLNKLHLLNSSEYLGVLSAQHQCSVSDFCESSAKHLSK